MENPSWVPADVDTSQGNVARIWDWLIGGDHNFPADREMGRKLLTVEPDGKQMALECRTFLRRVVHHLATEAGIDQFIDIGSGIPTRGNVHEIAQEVNPDAKVAYVDIDPIAVAHGSAMLKGNDHAAAVRGDLLDPGSLLREPELCRLIDLDRPVAVLLLAVVHFLRDEDDPAGIVGTLRDACAPGSYMAITHGTNEEEPEESEAVTTMYSRSVTSVVLRGHAEIESLFDGYELLSPGLVPPGLWRPDPPGSGQTSERRLLASGVARKP